MKVCVVSSTRADYGLLRPVLRGLGDAPGMTVQLLVTGTHLSPEFGLTVRDIEQDGFEIDERVEMLLSSDTPVGITKSFGLTACGVAEGLDRLRPDIVLLLGDRYEILAVATAALIARIPVAHLCGGDITEGAIDDALRHAISKLSHLHFVTNEGAAERVRQMGEDPRNVIVSGNPGIDELVRFQPLPREELEASLGLRLRERNLLVTYHPVTLAEEPAEAAFDELLAALETLGDDVGIVLTLPNADTWGRALFDMNRRFADRWNNAVAHESLGQERYWSCLKTFDAVVGNSSSGLMEAPVAGIPAVNIGERQRGRLQADTTIDCPAERELIADAIARALAWREVPVSSPYGDGHAVERIVDTLTGRADHPSLLVKHFHRR